MVKKDWGFKKKVLSTKFIHSLHKYSYSYCTSKEHHKDSTHRNQKMKSSLKTADFLGYRKDCIHCNQKLKSSLLKFCWSLGGLVAQSCPTLVTPWTIVCQAPLSMGFPRLGYWSGLPFPFPGDLSNPGIKPMSPTLADRFYTTEPPGKPIWHNTYWYLFYTKLLTCLCNVS